MKNIGDKIYWVESYAHYGKQIPCEMCFGKGLVTIILGDESQTKVECGACSHGLDRATGSMKTWEPAAIVYSGEITGVSTHGGVKYQVGHKTLDAFECIETKEEAENVREVKLKEQQERAAIWFREEFIRTKKSQIWSASYHRGCIKDMGRKISWHQMRLGMIEEKSK